MFFIQGQLSENKCGLRTEMPAYFYLTLQMAPIKTDQVIVNLNKSN